MKKWHFFSASALSIFFVLTVFSIDAPGRSTPDNMVVSHDSLMLLLKRQPMTGLYDLGSIRTILLSNANIKAEPPVISKFEYESPNGINQTPFSNKQVAVRATVNSVSGISDCILYYGRGLSGTFEKTKMYDDGLHNDRAASDGTYGALVPGGTMGSYLRYYIEAVSAENFLNSAYSPQGAEHDVYFFQVRPVIESNPAVVINELMAANTKTLADPQGEFDDWAELFNTSANDVDMSGMYLSDKADNPKKWQFPANTIIKSGDYLLVWLDENSKATPGIHTNFKLSASGEMLMLVNTDANGNTIVDQMAFGVQDEDISFGRYPNGTGPFSKMSPTPGAFNDNSLPVIEEIDYFSMNQIADIHPNPLDAGQTLNFDVSIASPQDCSVEIRDITGRIVNRIHPGFLDMGSHRLTWNGLAANGVMSAPGVYFLCLRSDSGYQSRPAMVVVR